MLSRTHKLMVAIQICGYCRVYPADNLTSKGLSWKTSYNGKPEEMLLILY
jgi:hypothetical protein